MSGGKLRSENTLTVCRRIYTEGMRPRPNCRHILVPYLLKQPCTPH